MPVNIISIRRVESSVLLSGGQGGSRQTDTHALTFRNALDRPGDLALHVSGMQPRLGRRSSSRIGTRRSLGVFHECVRFGREFVLSAGPRTAGPYKHECLHEAG